MRQVVCGVIIAAAAGLAQVPAVRPAFEVASVKLNPNCAGGRGRGANGGGAPVPGRLNIGCFAANDYIQAAYSMFADGVTQNPRVMQIFGGPAWTVADTYDIDARTGDNSPIAKMYGPMLQALLEDRFRLKIHKETRELPVYTLTVAKNGPKLQATKEGTCVVLDLNHPAEAPAARGTPLVRCGSTSSRGNAVTMTVDGHGLTLAGLAARSFYTRLERPVIDKTGLTGMFDIHLEFAADNMLEGRNQADGAVPANASAPSIFTAVQEQLGLKLTPEKGLVEVLVIDHIEKPSEN